MRQVPILAACAVLLAACSETDQSMTSENTSRSDVAAWQGAKNPHVAPGWTPGDKGSWENQIRTRGQQQNEYVKVN